jgi:transposase-like protein
MARRTAHPREVRERAVALEFEQVKTGEYESQWAVICSVAAKVNVSSETLRKVGTSGRSGRGDPGRAPPARRPPR